MINSIREIFAKSFLVTRMWEVLFNRQTGSKELTLKQLMLLIVVDNAFDHSPTIKEIANELATSHQNVKVLLGQLEKKEFVELYTDENDKRVTRVRTSELKSAYWKERSLDDQKMLVHLFDGLTEEELKITARAIDKLTENAKRLM
ncbi:MULTISPECIES: MarR family winged helix-turn-helix transcriptional regulator [unclassified Fusibacter]|uniref:MarR family winged helix-turn-helix transcriptional regulator n=1 Tax=unclassified Fusibacter TaxID=2624464 RepID=UPI0010120AB6|nr:MULTISPECIES: MarR family transcriptional regulator [unclassified Fusibacter]MCK8058997.1 MarR family transcriptional regulator [Fusibacter sp. A2]NPE22408.1 MarR family transcriptional regulator [Fusibacter sp. A1]RXV60514.1 MarR family transcriptional regulator [Fusibacter sp. A1]